MRKILIISVLALLGLSQAIAQNYEYIPFVREGVKWICSYPKAYSYDEDFFTLELKGDVTIGGKVYKAMHKYSGAEIDPENDTIPVYLREEGKVVYGIVPDGKTYEECPVGIENNTLMLEQIASGEEFVLYDFNDPVGFIKSFLPEIMNSMVIPDMVTVSGKKARRFIFYHMGHDYCLIDGIGYDGAVAGYPLAVIYNLDRKIYLSKVLDHGEIVYQSEHYKSKESCDPYLRLTREGVQWVNQLVTVNGNDTTYSYYTFEFKGVNSRNQPVLYYCAGETIDETATPATVFNNNFAYEIDIYTYYVNETEPFREIMEEGRSMMHYLHSFPSYPLYQFNPSQSDISIMNPLNYYIYNQNGDWLTKENFIEVEPIVIEDTPCSRYAYVNEQGEPQFYIVEGIGFDSRDMGDLLTPFTRKPDPTAAHQEWCGLSHVVKDGKIIYKGMCYDPSIFENQPGDVNGDGVVNISDVVALIDYVLNDTTPSISSSADMDGNGRLNISDVTKLINQVLNQ